MRFYLYDFERDTHGKQDALGNVSDGLVEIVLTANCDLIVRDDDGSELALSSTRDGSGIEIRNNHRRGVGGLAVIPRSTNVIEVLPSDR